MRKIIEQCDGCHISLENARSFHVLELDFKTYFKDPNTLTVEEMTNMTRKTKNTYCTKCFKAFVAKTDEFIEEVMPKTADDLNPEQNADIAAIQSDLPDAGSKEV